MAERDLISRQAAIDKFKSIITDREYTNITDEAKERMARKFFADIPSSDSVEVVRCKDCKYDHKCSHNIIRPSKGGGVIYCPLEYCSEGESKEE